MRKLSRFILDSLAERLDSLPAPVLTPSDYDVLNVKLVKDSRMGLGICEILNVE